MDDDLSYRGKSTKLFEDKLSEYVEAYVVCTNTGTAALHLSLNLLGIQELDNIICPSITYVATANPIIYCGAEPIFCDVKDDLTIDEVRLEKYLKETNENIKAIIVVHLLGNTCNMKKIKTICKKYKLLLIEDACQALGSWYHGKHCGTIGDIGCLSFNGNKIITTGGGGAIITKDKKIRDLALHYSMVGKVSTSKQCYHDVIGYNYRMPAWNARLGLKQLKKCSKLRSLKKKAKKNNIVTNEWKKIDDDGYKIWTPLHQLPMYENNPRTDCSNAERIGREVKIK